MNVFCKLLVGTFLICTIPAAVAATGKVYKWTDDKGLVHYSQRPPLNTQTEVIKPVTAHSDPAPAATPAEPAKKEVAVAAAPAKDKSRCENARKNLETLTTYTRIKVKGDNGEYRYMTPDEQAQHLKEANKAIEESCE